MNFLLAGAVFAKYFVDARLRKEEDNFIKSSFIVGLIALLSGHLFYSGIFPEAMTTILPNPVFYLERLGYILVLFYFCWIVDNRFNKKPVFILDASRESLLVYWLHLIIIYGMLWNEKSLAQIVGNNLNVFEASLATIALMMLMIIIAKIWGLLKSYYPKQTSLAVKFLVVILVLVFVIK